MKSSENNTQIRIQPCSLDQTSTIFKIASDTAFFGEPVEIYLEDRNLFCDIFYRYYITFQIDVSLVAMINQNVVGFIMGCYDTKIQIKQWISSILPLIMKKTVGGQYHFGPLTWHYLFALCRQKMVEKKQVIDLSVYPAHLHINVDKDWRGLGIGEKLLQEYINLLKGKKVVGVHLNTTDQNQAACKLYEKMGFQLIASHSTKLWSYWLDHLVEIRSYGLRL